jgi:hypothetical protein
MYKYFICLMLGLLAVQTGGVGAEPEKIPDMAAFLALEDGFAPPEPEPLPPPPEADRLEAAQKLANVMGLETSLQKQAELMYGTLLSPMYTFLDRQFDDQLNQIMHPFFDYAHQRLRDEIDWETVLKNATEEYARTFTVAELEELSVFYSSPLGKRLLTEAPRILQLDWPEVEGRSNYLLQALGEEFGRRLMSAYETILSARREKAGVVVGQPFPAFKGPCVEGSHFDSSVLNGKVTFMTSWAYQIQEWVANLPRLRELHDQYRDQGFAIVGFSLNYIDEQEDRAAFLKENPMPWPNLAVGYDEGLEVSESLILDGAPVSYLIDRDGLLIAINPSLEELPSMIEKALKKEATPVQ